MISADNPAKASRDLRSLAERSDRSPGSDQAHAAAAAARKDLSRSNFQAAVRFLARRETDQTGGLMKRISNRWSYMTLLHTRRSCADR